MTPVSVAFIERTTSTWINAASKAVVPGLQRQGEVGATAVANFFSSKIREDGHGRKLQEETETG